MDSLFRSISRLQSSSLITSRSRNSTATASSVATHRYLLRQEECASATPHPLGMDEEDSSSRSASPSPSANLRRCRPSSSSSITDPADLSLLRDLNVDLFSSSSQGNAGDGWAFRLLLECARAVAAAGSGRDGERVQRLMWMLNELSSPYGDVEQKVAACFLQGLFARVTSSGGSTLRSLSAASDRNCSFHSTRRTALRFQELSPWASFGHVAANGAIVESFLQRSSSASGAQRFHILDLSSTFCTQWPTLLEALATRSPGDAPHVSITTVASSASTSSSAVQKVMKEIGQRMERFARLMGVPFRFRVIHHPGDLSDLDLDRLNLREGGTAALAVNCINTLHAVSPGGRRREKLVGALSRLKPLIVTVVEEEADLEGAAAEEDGEAFLKRFCESLRFFSAYFESLEESFPRASEERLALERAAGRAVVDLLACPASESAERRGTAAGWSRRMQEAGFRPAAFSEDVADDARALLRRYREGWSTREEGGGASGMFLAWRGQPVVWASAWKP